MVDNITNEQGQIIGYPPGRTFSSVELGRLSPDLKTYVFAYSGFWDDVEVRAISLPVALRALGWDSPYEWEWGDHRGLLECIKDGIVAVFEKVVSFVDLTEELDSIVREG